MKKKSMISALVLSVAMIGISTSGAFADEYQIGGQIGDEPNPVTAGSANAGVLNNTTDAPALMGQWVTPNEGDADSITVGAGGTLTIQGYTAADAQDPIVNGILQATGGQVNLTGGTLTLGDDSSVANAVVLNVGAGNTVDLTGGSLYVGANDTINGTISAAAGSLTFTGANMYLDEHYQFIDSSADIQVGTAEIDNAALTIQHDVTTTGDLTNYGTITNDHAVVVDDLVNYGTIGLDANETGALTIGGGSNSGQITQNNFTINGDFDNTGAITANDTITVGTGVAFNNNGVLEEPENPDSDMVNATVQADTVTNQGGTINLTNADLTAGTINNNTVVVVEDEVEVTHVGTINLNNGSLTVTDEDSNLSGTINVIGESNNITLGDENQGLFVYGTFDGTLNIQDNTTLNFNAGMMETFQDQNNPEVHIGNNATLNIGIAPIGGEEGAVGSVELNNNDTWAGSGNINLINGTLDIEGNMVEDQLVASHFGEGPDGPVGYSQGPNGQLSIKDGSSLTVQDASQIDGGTMRLTSGSTFNDAGLGGENNEGGFNLDILNTAGTVGAINNNRENYSSSETRIGNNDDDQADFTIDVLGRSNRRNETDHFNLQGEDSNGITAGNEAHHGIVNISDWELNGDLYGWDAPIDRHISLNNVFQGQAAEGHQIDFTTDSDKEVFTPIGWYKLNANAERPGSYTLDLARFNPWVFRGQVTKIAQYQNQLAIDDMLFTHSMVLPSFKENDHGVNASILSNRYAAGSPLYAPYEYSRKDGGVWCKMYGNFEHLNMNRGLNVENNSFGALIGADLGLKELGGGWTFMPTAYLGYNGAHQHYARQGAWQNGGQAGFLGTWYKDNFIIGALVYGGVYNNEMDTPRGNDDAFNYFAGGSVKTAYNWRFHRDWVLQPNFLVAYNFFGKENWHSDFGQMGMMSGQLHGVNVAPGLNLIWEKDTFSAYATLQYMYNINQSVGGRAGNVGLPNIHMDRGYIQYGLGFNKRFGERFSGYLQAVFRNVGRTGVGFQGGFNFALGKTPSNYNTALKGHTPTMQKAKTKMSASHS